MSGVLRIEGLAIKLPKGADRKLAVEGIDLELAAGQTLCVVGESGNGRCDHGLDRLEQRPVAGIAHDVGLQRRFRLADLGPRL